MDNSSKEIEVIKKFQVEIIELKNAMIKIKKKQLYSK